ncbi:MAG: hypothetical protein ACYDD6_07510 [Acidimicrobiales bacterium]
MDGRQPVLRDVALHVSAAALVLSFLALGWWQVTRALSGNSLSWAYVFEWPFFAGYVVFMWWRLSHDRPRPTAGPPTSDRDAEAVGPDPAEEHGEELAEYNRYLAALEESGKRKTW